MGKILAVMSAALLCALVFLASFSSAASQGQRSQYVNVGISYGSAAVSSCMVAAEDGLMLVQAVPGGMEEVLRLPECKQLTVKTENRNIVAIDSLGAVVYEAFDLGTCIASLSAGEGGAVKFNGKPFRGALRFSPLGNGAMNVVNYIEMDDYLCGVIGAEMGHASPIEALKAQAVAARSFALCNLGKHKEEGFDFCTGVHCQVYEGQAGEHDRTTQAVDETAGLVLTYGGKPAAGYFFKNSGGHTQSGEEVWGGDAPWLVGVKDEYSPDCEWSYSMTFQEIRSKLEAAGYKVGKVQSVSIVGRSASGAAARLEIKGASGTATLAGENVRAVFGSGNVKSMMFYLGGSENTQTSGALPNPALSDGKSAVFPKGSDDVYVIGADMAAEKKKLSELYAFDSGLSFKLAGSKQAEPQKLESVSKEPVVFNGSGYGHGVGMPQDSAVAMAEQGFTYEEILKYYFKNIKIQ
ncbi:MAG: SpoIID/LytB domain-containing protein [Clostridiales bacterium]|nr:SpoIID/LytB domain-containing protein [Clostridiales bacterium]